MKRRTIRLCGRKDKVEDGGGSKPIALLLGLSVYRTNQHSAQFCRQVLTNMAL